jgi:hypothetical protein
LFSRLEKCAQSLARERRWFASYPLITIHKSEGIEYRFVSLGEAIGVVVLRRIGMGRCQLLRGVHARETADDLCLLTYSFSTSDCPVNRMTGIT